MKKMKKLLWSILMVLAVTIAAPAGITGLNTCTEVQAAITVPTPKLASVKAYGTSKTILKWNPVDKATGYRVYRKVDGMRWRALDTFSGRTNVTYTDSRIKPGTCYVYTVRAYRKVDGKTIWSNYDKTGLRVVTGLDTPAFSVKNISTPEQCAAKISINEVSGARGYVVYRRRNANEAWKRIAVTPRNYFVDKKVSSGRTYYYTVRAYCRYYDKTYYSNYNRNGIGCKVSSEGAAFNKLKNYILSKGYTDTDGNKYVAAANEDSDGYYQWAFVYNKNKNRLELEVYLDFGDFANSITVYVNENPSAVKSEFIFVMESPEAGVRATAQFNASGYTGQDVLFVIQEEINMSVTTSEVNELANQVLQLGFLGWEELLNENLNMSLRQLGFKSYYPN